jgi:hypothetical protein
MRDALSSLDITRRRNLILSTSIADNHSVLPKECECPPRSLPRIFDSPLRLRTATSKHQAYKAISSSEYRQLQASLRRHDVATQWNSPYFANSQQKSASRYGSFALSLESSSFHAISMGFKRWFVCPLSTTHAGKLARLSNGYTLSHLAPGYTHEELDSTSSWRLCI